MGQCLRVHDSTSVQEQAVRLTCRAGVDQPTLVTNERACVLVHQFLLELLHGNAMFADDTAAQSQQLSSRWLRT